ncbi:ATP-binding protein [Hoylesella shahii]
MENIYNERYRSPLPLLDYISQRVTDTREYFILIDEIQLLDRFEEVLNTLLKNPQLDMYVTGSNARFLSKDVVTTFRGRGDELRIHPLSFSEYMPVKPDVPFLETHLNEYMLLGGLPQTVTMPTEQQKKGYLQQLFSNTYLVDIKERYSIRNDDDLEELIDVMASSIGSLTNPQKIANTRRSAKRGTITRDTA